jgi:hypothetical protein
MTCPDDQDRACLKELKKKENPQMRIKAVVRGWKDSLGTLSAETLANMTGGGFPKNAVLHGTLDLTPQGQADAENPGVPAQRRFWRLIASRRRQKTISRAELERRIAGKRAKRSGA